MTVNESKKRDPRFWLKWDRSGAKEILDKYQLGFCFLPLHPLVNQIPEGYEVAMVKEKPVIVKRTPSIIYNWENGTGLPIGNTDLGTILLKGQTFNSLKFIGNHIRENYPSLTL